MEYDQAINAKNYICPNHAHDIEDGATDPAWGQISPSES
jgi:hypothetical protein